MFHRLSVLIVTSAMQKHVTYTISIGLLCMFLPTVLCMGIKDHDDYLQFFWKQE